MRNARQMVEEIRKGYGLDSPGVFEAMLQVPREKFVPVEYVGVAWDDRPVPIGNGQTVSQPFTVAFMTDLLDLEGREKVLEIGTGSGYQAAILSLLSGEVYSIERIPELAMAARKRLKKLGYTNIQIKVGSGEFGWREKSPFDAILVTAGMDDVPRELFNQLKSGGTLVSPVGKSFNKKMTRYTKTGKGIKSEEFGVFNFVPFLKSD